MKVTNVKKEGKILEFDVSKVSASMMNTLRRTVISHIPCMAVEDIIYSTNTSILNDENLSHRIGLLPLTTDLDSYETQQNCSCGGEGCGRCTCTLELDVKGPDTAYSKDIKSQDERVRPVYDTSPLVKLMPKHHVKFEAKARIGTGKEHVKWQAGICSYELLDNGSYHVFVESYGQLPVEELVKKAFEVVGEEIGKLEKAVS